MIDMMLNARVGGLFDPLPMIVLTIGFAAGILGIRDMTREWKDFKDSQRKKENDDETRR